VRREGEIMCKTAAGKFVRRWWGVALSGPMLLDRGVVPAD